MRKQLLVLGLVALVALAGCSALQDGDQPGVDSDDEIGGETLSFPVEDGISNGDSDSGATNVSYAVGIEVSDSVAGENLSAVGATYPRENFTVHSAQHEDIIVGVDTDDDGEIDREFEEGTVSGVNNNAFSFDVTLDTDYTLQSGDVVVIEYPDVDNPAESGSYTVGTRLNDQETADVTVGIE